MFSLHAQLTRDSAPDARYKKLLLNSVVCWACALVACYIPALAWFRPVQRSSVEVTSKFRCGFNRHQPLLKSLSVTLRFAFSVCQCFTGLSKGNFFIIARSASKALSEVGSCSCFIVGICINFFYSSCTHLSFACFLRFFTFCFVFIELVSS